MILWPSHYNDLDIRLTFQIQLKVSLSCLLLILLLLATVDCRCFIVIANGGTQRDNPAIYKSILRLNQINSITYKLHHIYVWKSSHLFCAFFSFHFICIGAIIIKNWKPLPLDKITDNTLISVSEILGELTSSVTLKITIIRTKPTQLAEIKDKLLKLLILQSHTVLRSSGCPLDEVST